VANFTFSTSTKELKKALKNEQPACCFSNNNPENGKIYGKLNNFSMR
jgi:hypothetical protein